MSKNPKVSFLSTLGKHLVAGSNLLPAVEPTPPKEATTEPPKAEPQAEPKTEPPKTEPTAAEPTKAEPTKTETTKAETPPAAPAEPPKPAEPEPTIPKKRSEPLPPVSKDDLDDGAAPAPEEPKPVTALLDYQPTKSEVRYLEVLQSAADRDPEKYQAVLDREADRMKKVNKWVADYREKNDGAEPVDPETGRPVAEYARFLKANPPAIDAAEHDELREEQIAERARARASEDLRKEMEPKLRKVAEIEAKPIISEAEKQVEQAVLAALPATLGKDDYLVEIAKDGVDALSKVPSEGKVFSHALKRGREVVSEFIRLRRGLVSMDPRNEVHVFISRSVASAADIFEKQGGADRIRDGKRFVTPATFSKLKPEARAKHWTFEEGDVIEIVATMTAAGALQELDERRKERAELENFRKPKTPAGEKEKKPAAPAEPPKSSPAVTPTPTSTPTTPPPPKNPTLRKHLGL